MRDTSARLSPVIRLATVNGVLPVLRLHIMKGGDINARDCNGATPLILAAARGKTEAVRLLLDAGADPVLQDDRAMDAFAHARQNGSVETIELLERFFPGRAGEEGHGCMAGKSSEPVVIEGTHSGGDIFEPEPEAIGRMGMEHATGVVPESILAEAGYPHARPEDSICKACPDNSEGIGLGSDPGGHQFVTGAIILPALGLVTDSETRCDRPLQLFTDDGWEAEEEAKVPEGDSSVQQAARETFSAIGRHRAVDSDAGWDEIDLYLPDHVVLLSADAEDGQVRNTLFIAIHDGTVTEQAVVESCLKPDGERDQDAERLLAITIAEAGGTILEWCGGAGTCNADPSEAETYELADAMEFFSQLGDGYNEPFRFYSRDMRGELLTADQEIALGQKIEQAGRDAAIALASWPAGLELLYNAAWMVTRGLAKVESFCEMEEPLPDADGTQGDGKDLKGAVKYDGVDSEDVRSNEREYTRCRTTDAFLEAVHAIQEAEGNKDRMVQLLSELKLSREFLSRLEELASSDEESGEFTAALERKSVAIGELVVRNLRLAFSTAKKFQWSGLPLDDLIQEANLGLITAAGRYDWRRGFRFSTYATWWVRQAVGRGVADKSMIVRAPVHVQDKARAVLRGIRDAERDLGRAEKEHETVARTGLDPARLRMMLNLFNEPVSLDETDPETKFNRVDGIAAPQFMEPQHVADQDNLHLVIMGMLLEMDEREREVIILRFGLTGEDPMTLEEVGQHYGVTRERIRQIEAKAMRRLRHPCRTDVLAPFME